jgi:hypothetical protein
MVKLTDNIKENFPFLSVITYGGEEYVGIIINQDQYVTTVYNVALIKSEEEKERFLELGEIWWWESNRMIPINIFLRGEIEHFKYCQMTMNSKDVKVVLGPTVNLNDMSIKRVKRKSVQLVRKPKN